MGHKVSSENGFCGYSHIYMKRGGVRTLSETKRCFNAYVVVSSSVPDNSAPMCLEVFLHKAHWVLSTFTNNEKQCIAHLFFKKGSVCMNTRCVNIQNDPIARKCANVWRVYSPWTLYDTSCSDDTIFPSLFSRVKSRVVRLMWCSVEEKFTRKPKTTSERVEMLFCSIVIIWLF